MSREKSCFGILFSLSIIIGIGLGIIIRQGMAKPEDNPDSIAGSALGSQMQWEQDESYGQKYLIIGVDNGSGEAHLQGAWLAKLSNPADHPAGTIEIILITLYPLMPEHVITPEQSPYTVPHSPIIIDVNNLTSLEMLEPLSFKENEWSQVIVMDEVAINAAIQLSNVNQTGPINTPTADLFIKSWENPEKAFRQQWGIITTLCTEPEAYSQFKTIQQIAKLYGTHIFSTLDYDGLIKLWQVVNYKQNDTIDCEIYPQLAR